MMRSALFSWVILCSALPVIACTGPEKKPIVSAAMADGPERRTTVEASLLVLDEHEDYGHEAYEAVRKHPKTFHRMIAESARDMKDPVFADEVVSIVVKDPEGFGESMVVAIKKTPAEPKTQAMFTKVVTQHAPAAVGMIVEDHAAMSALLDATIDAAEKSDKARASLVEALQKAAPRLVQLIAQDPKLLTAVGEAIFKAEMHDKAALKETLKKLIKE